MLSPEYRTDGKQVVCLRERKTAHVVVEVWYPETGYWIQSVKPLFWWDNAKPCEAPEGSV